MYLEQVEIVFVIDVVCITPTAAVAMSESAGFGRHAGRGEVAIPDSRRRRCLLVPHRLLHRQRPTAGGYERRLASSRDGVLRGLVRVSSVGSTVEPNVLAVGTCFDW